LISDGRLELDDAAGGRFCARPAASSCSDANSTLQPRVVDDEARCDDTGAADAARAADVEVDADVEADADDADDDDADDADDDATVAAAAAAASRDASDSAVTTDASKKSTTLNLKPPLAVFESYGTRHVLSATSRHSTLSSKHSSHTNTTRFL
jgi:hypothetical protein